MTEIERMERLEYELTGLCAVFARLSSRVKALEALAPTPEPSPDTKAERYTVEVAHEHDSRDYGTPWRIDDRLEGTIAVCPMLPDAQLIAAALNSTPDPLLVGLVDACRAWREDVGAAAPYHAPLVARLLFAIDAYLAEQEGE